MGYWPAQSLPSVGRPRPERAAGTAVEQDGPMASNAVTPDIPTLIDAVDDASTRLVTAVENTIDTGGVTVFAAPSLIDGWTLGHVVSHLSRNADALRNVLDGAEHGEQRPLYTSREERDAEIEAGARLDTESIARDFEQTTRFFTEKILAAPDDVWTAPIDLRGPTTADTLLWARLAELEFHHHDLGVDDHLARLDQRQLALLFAALQRTYLRTRWSDGSGPGFVLAPDDMPPITVGGGGPTISGAPAAVALWLGGRSDGSDLQTDGDLPELPAW